MTSSVSTVITVILLCGRDSLERLVRADFGRHFFLKLFVRLDDKVGETLRPHRRPVSQHARV